MNNPIPFRLDIELATPISMHHRLTLDGLLSAAVFRQTGLIAEATYPHIPLVQEHGVFRGSSLNLPTTAMPSSFGRVMSLRGPQDLSLGVFSPNVRNKRYGAVDQQRGPYKANLTRYQAISTPHAWFYGLGDPDACVFLIENFIQGLGKRANGGAGEITGVNWFETDEDLSWVSEKGQPARPLPKELWAEIMGTTLPVSRLAVRPPYWQTERVPAVFPA